MVAHRDRLGELKLLTSILRDLRDQKAVETRLRLSEAELQALNAQLEAGVADRTRRLEQLHQELEAFSASVAQDLEAPLSSVDGDSRRILEEFGAVLPEAAHTLLQELSGSAARMRTLIDSLLQNSRTAR
jgi:signal transduction histidine kinase